MRQLKPKLQHAPGSSTPSRMNLAALRTLTDRFAEPSLPPAQSPGGRHHQEPEPDLISSLVAEVGWGCRGFVVWGLGFRVWGR